jgi:HEAT repeat protein
MRVAPRKYFRDTRYALFSEYLDMLGFIFRDKDEFDGISRKAAIDYLRAAIKLPGRHNIIAVLDALRGLEIRDSRSVIPLLRNSDPVVRLYAVDFLIWAPHESAVEPLSDILDASDGSDPVLAKAVSRALTKINTAAAHRALQTAMKKGIITETSESRQ